MELAALDQFINLLLENGSKYFDDLLSGERSLPFGLLFIKGRLNLLFKKDMFALSLVNRLSQTESAVCNLWMLYFQTIHFSE